ncbi:hypothetical protein ACVMB1_006057 [Bradyrhizobium sp. USDA 4504]
MGLDLVPRSPLKSVQMPANAVRGRSSASANQTTSFFFVSRFGSGAYSAKLLNGTRQRFSGLSQPRQCGDEVLRMFVTGGPPVRGGGHAPAHHDHLALFGGGIPDHGGRVVRKHAGHRREVTDVTVDHAEEVEDRGLVCSY